MGDDTTPTDAQSLNSLNGKILRINRGGKIPTNNPFYNSTSGGSRAIWALGLRQPYSLDVQSGTSKMFVNDVGENTWEEIDEVTRGANYGWPIHEGATSSPDPSLQNYQDPVFAYGHGATAETGCSITGGAFYQDAYFYTDYCGGWIRSFDAASGASAPFATGIVKPVDLEVGNNGGSLYYVVRRSSSVPASVHEIKKAGT